MLLILYRGMAALGVTLFGGMAEYTEYSNVLRVSMRFESVYMYILFLFWVLKYSVYSVFCLRIFCVFFVSAFMSVQFKSITECSVNSVF